MAGLWEDVGGGQQETRAHAGGSRRKYVPGEPLWGQVGPEALPHTRGSLSCQPAARRPSVGAGTPGSFHLSLTIPSTATTLAFCSFPSLLSFLFLFI